MLSDPSPHTTIRRHNTKILAKRQLCATIPTRALYNLHPEDGKPRPPPPASPARPRPHAGPLRRRQLGWVGVAAGLGRAPGPHLDRRHRPLLPPLAVSVIYLNRDMPLEGGLYVWARTAFGDLGGFITAWNLWFYGVAVTADHPLRHPHRALLPHRPLRRLAARKPPRRPSPSSPPSSSSSPPPPSSASNSANGSTTSAASPSSSSSAALILLPLWAIAHHQPIHYEPLPIATPPPQPDLPRPLRPDALRRSLRPRVHRHPRRRKQGRRPLHRPVRLIASPIICAMFILGTSSVLAFSRPGHIDFIAPIPQTLRYALGNSGLANLFAMAAILLLQFRLIAAASFIFTGVTRLPMTAGWDAPHPRLVHPPPPALPHPHQLHRSSPAPSSCFSSSSPTSASTHRKPSRSSTTPPSPTTSSPTSPCSPSRSSAQRPSASNSPAGSAGPPSPASPPLSSAFLISAYPFVDVVNPRAYAAKILGTILLSNIIGYTFYRLRNKPKRTTHRVSAAS